MKPAQRRRAGNLNAPRAPVPSARPFSIIYDGLQQLRRTLIEVEPSPTIRDLGFEAFNQLERILWLSIGPEAVSATEEREHHYDVFLEIMSWIAGGPVASAPTLRDVISDAMKYINDGAPKDAAARYAEMQLQLTRRAPKRGAPPTDARKRAIVARDFRLAIPPVSWLKIAHRLCKPCNKTRHDRKCAEKIRAQVTELERFLQTLKRR